MNYGLKAGTVVGYTYAAESVCPDCVVRAMGEHQGQRTTEDALDLIAMRRGIDRGREWTFDSDEFPKVLFASDAWSGTYADTCGSCGVSLTDR